MEGMRDFAKNCTMHGIYHVLTSKNLTGKILWSVLLLASSSYVTYQVIAISRSFLDYSVVTKVEKKIEKPLRFPAVTFCPSDGQSQTFISANRMTFVNGTKVREIFKEAERGKKFIVVYTFGGQLYKYPAHFEKVIIPDDGLCYTFNSNGTLFQYRAGANHGLNIRLFINASNYLYGNGVRISVRSQDEFAFPSIDGIGISPGFSSLIGLKKRTMIRKESPFTSDCTHGHEEHQIYPGKYTVTNCEFSCVEQEMIDRCDLTYSFVSPLYLPKETISRLLRHYNESLAIKCISKKDMYRSIITADCHCRVPCYEIVYEKTLSFIKLNNENHLDVIIYFEELLNEIITEIPEWTFTKLLSDIGGLTGIWLGASVFSVIELLMLVGWTPFYVLHNKRNTYKKTEHIEAMEY